jgi:hypothetical protein
MLRTINYSPTISISIIIFQSILIIYFIYQNNVSFINSQKELLEVQEKLFLKKPDVTSTPITTISIKQTNVSKCRPHSELINEFREIGSNPVTDKVYGHSYQHLYGG